MKLGARIYRWLLEQDADEIKKERDAAGLCTCGNPSGMVLTMDPPLCGSCRKPLSRRN